MEKKFIADVHLGRLAKWLRMLGFDTLYNNAFASGELVTLAGEENRILLSRNSTHSKNDSIDSLIITHEEPALQLQQVIQHFDLKESFRPFTRCLVCNGFLENVSKEAVLSRLQPNTAAFFHEFWQCLDCKRIYWKGSHFDRMMKMIESMQV